MYLHICTLNIESIEDLSECEHFEKYVPRGYERRRGRGLPNRRVQRVRKRIQEQRS